MASSSNSDLEKRFNFFLLEIPNHLTSVGKMMEIAFRFGIEHNKVKIWIENFPGDIVAICYELIHTILRNMTQKTVQEKISIFASACHGSCLPVETILKRCNISPSEWKLQ